MKICKVFLTAAAMACCFHAAAAVIPEGIQPDYHHYFNSKEHLLQGGTAIFDDCIIAVGSAVNNPDRPDTMRAVALADANSILAGAIYGVAIKAQQEIKDESTQKDSGEMNASSSVKSIYRALIENRSLNRSVVCGEWLSADQKTCFVAVARFVKAPKNGKALPVPAKPSFLLDFNPDSKWENALLTLRGIMRGGAAVYFDEYGEEHLITVASAPKSLPYSHIQEMLRIKAGTEAVGYVNGSLINDRRYLEENFNENISTEESEAEAEVIRKHIQTTVRQGAVRGMVPIGTWNLTTSPKRTYQAFALRLSDVAMESFTVIPEGADENSDTVEIDTADDSGKKLAAALKKAEFYEDDDEISVVVDDDTPILGNNENEVELVDPVQDIPVAGVVHQSAEKITPVVPIEETRPAAPLINFAPNVNIAPEVNVNVNTPPPAVNVVNVNHNEVNVGGSRTVLVRKSVPVRVYRKRAPGRRYRSKRIVVRRRSHFRKHHHHPHRRFRKAPRPPKFRIRHPKPGRRPHRIHRPRRSGKVRTIYRPSRRGKRGKRR